MLVTELLKSMNPFESSFFCIAKDLRKNDFFKFLESKGIKSETFHNQNKNYLFLNISVLKCDGYTQFIEYDAEMNILERTKLVGNDHYKLKDFKKADQAYHLCIQMA
jgi:hypothetical protein